MIVLAVDPGAVTGWALAQGGAVLASGVVRQPGSSKARPTLAHRQAAYAAAVAEELGAASERVWPPDALVVEWATGGGATRSMASLQRLPWRAGVWLGAVAGLSFAEDFARPAYHEVAPAEWGACAGLPVGPVFESAYTARGRDLLGREPVTPDEAAAVCLAVHASQRLALGLPVGRTEEEASEVRRDQGKAARARKRAASERP